MIDIETQYLPVHTDFAVDKDCLAGKMIQLEKGSSFPFRSPCLEPDIVVHEFVHYC